jgi:hypothetical protein
MATSLVLVRLHVPVAMSGMRLAVSVFMFPVNQPTRDEWDEASCQCVYVSCKPTHAPSLSPTTKNPTLTPSEYPSESPSSLGKSGKFPTYIPASPGPTDFPTKSPILHPTNDDDVR